MGAPVEASRFVSIWKIAITPPLDRHASAICSYFALFGLALRYFRLSEGCDVPRHVCCL
jgi:hypothetical protein